MGKYEAIEELESIYCSWGDTAHYNSPLKYFAACEGSFLFDHDGNRYLDTQMAYSAVNFGYKNQFLLQRLKEQIDTLPHVASEYMTEEKVLLAASINESIESFTKVKGRVHFNVGGSQAIDDSLKLISVNRGTRRVYAFEGSYHGRTIGASAITSSFRYRNRYGEFGSRAHFIPFPYCFRCPFGKKLDSCDYYCVKQFERLFESEYHAALDMRRGEAEFVAFYIEAIQGTGGYIVPPPEYFKQLHSILAEHKILFVDDEIQMGFFRTGKMWAIENFGVSPDIIAFGKSLTNGLNPVAGIWATEDLITPEKWPPGSTHSTFGSNPLGMSAGKAVFDWLATKDYASSVQEKGSYFLAGLRDLKAKYKSIGDVDGLGLALRIEVCFSDGFTPNKHLADTIKARGLLGDMDSSNGRLGILLDIGGYYKNVFTLSPSLEISFAEIDLCLELLDRLFHENQG